MKTRTGFVSNSSSTSFIVEKEHKKLADEFGIELVNVGKIRAICKQNIPKSEIDEELGNLNLWFLTGMCGDLAVSDFAKLKDSDYISKPFDRDRAYYLGVDFEPLVTDL